MKLFNIFFILIIFYGCATSNKVYYSYKLNNYTVQNNVSDLWSSSSLISYDDYLFEFIIRTKFKSDIYMKSDKKISSITYDTIGVYLLSGKRKLYFQFDTFSVHNNLVKTGKLINKEFGVGLTNTSLAPQFGKNENYKDTVIKGRPFYYLEYLVKKDNGTDSTISKIFFIKNPSFNSIYKISGIIAPDKNLCMVGFSHYLIDKKLQILALMEDMKVISDEENKTCQKLIEKAKHCITDTIGKSIYLNK